MVTKLLTLVAFVETKPMLYHGGMVSSESLGRHCIDLVVMHAWLSSRFDGDVSVNIQGKEDKARARQAGPWT